MNISRSGLAGLAPPVLGHTILAVVGSLPGQGDGGLEYGCQEYSIYTVHCTLYTVHCTLNTVHCTLYTVQHVHYFFFICGALDQAAV